MKFNGNTPTVFATFANVPVCDNEVGQFGWSSKNTVDKLCPAFTESDAAVRCEPVEGYPLEVVSTIAPKESGDTWGEIKLYHSGKNLCGDTPRYINKNGADVSFIDNILTFNGSWSGNQGFGDYSEKLSFLLPAGTYTWSVKRLSGKCSNAQLTIGFKNQKYGWTASYSSSTIPEFSKSFTVTEPTRLCFCAIGGGTFENYRYSVQLEAGEVGTAFEPYKGTTVYTADISADCPAEGSYNWTTGILMSEGSTPYQHNPETGELTPIDDLATYQPTVVRNIYAYQGVNTLVSDCGNTEVSGRADPKAMFEKLSSAIISLGGNV